MAASNHLENLFFASSPEPKDQLTPNLLGSIGVTCRSKNSSNCADHKSKMAAMVAILKIYFSWFFRNQLANCLQISHWSYCWNVIESLFKWSCSIDCHAIYIIFFFKIKNCLKVDLFISCDDRTGKMLHNICISAVAMSLRWATRGPWASCLFFHSNR